MSNKVVTISLIQFQWHKGAFPSQLEISFWKEETPKKTKLPMSLPISFPMYIKKVIYCTIWQLGLEEKNKETFPFAVLEIIL